MDKEAYDLGVQFGYLATVMPPDEDFVKVAAETNTDAGMLKQAYLEKIAAPGGWGAGLGKWLGGAAGHVGKGLMGLPWWALGGLGLGAGLMGANALRGIGGTVGNALLGPVTNSTQLDPYHRQLQQQQMYNLALSRDLQAARGAYAPAPNPFG